MSLDILGVADAGGILKLDEEDVISVVGTEDVSLTDVKEAVDADDELDVDTASAEDEVLHVVAPFGLDVFMYLNNFALPCGPSYAKWQFGLSSDTAWSVRRQNPGEAS